MLTPKFIYYSSKVPESRLFVYFYVDILWNVKNGRERLTVLNSDEVTSFLKEFLNVRGHFCE